jgi:hypothetical protein
MTVNDTFLTEDEAIDLYDSMIDEGGPVVVAGMEFVASHALKLLDPIAYRVGFSDYTDALIQDGYEIEGY